MDRFEMPTVKCERCFHEWVPRVKLIRQCPRCKNVKWNVPKESKHGDVK